MVDAESAGTREREREREMRIVGETLIGIESFLETSQGEWAIHTWEPSDFVVEGL